MNKTKNQSFIKFSVVLITLYAFLLNSVPTAKACGPSPMLPYFSYEVRPDSLEQYVAGELGILQPKFARSYLVVAYRVLNEMPPTKDQQEQLVRLWKYRLRISSEKESEQDSKDGFTEQWMEMRDAMNQWSEMRAKVLANPNDSPDVNKMWRWDYNDFNSYANCTTSSFTTAAKTLQKRLEKYSDDTENIKEWIKGQDTVFSNCKMKGSLPESVNEDAPDWLKKDRDYQIAAAHFYAGNFDEAKAKFEEISRDNSSDWSNISNYLIARTYLREASINEGKAFQSTSKAEEHLNKILADKNLKDVHEMSRQLLYVAANRQKTKTKFGEFSKTLSSKKEISDIRREVETYTNYLDNFGLFEDKAERIEYIEKQKPKPIKKSEPTFWEWLWALFFGEEETQNPKLTEPKIIVADYKDIREDDYDYYWEDPKVKNLLHFPSKLNFAEVTETAKSEDISSWIFAFQANDKEAYKFSLEKWRETSKTHWLLAAISNAEVEYDETENLIKQADKIQSDSPAFATTKYHQIRLLIEQKKHDEARKKLDAFLKEDQNKMPVSTQNRFFRQRMLAARDLDEFLTFAKRKAVAFMAYEYANDETSEIENSYGYYDDEGSELLVWRNRWMFDEDTAEILNKQIPLEMLIEIGANQNLPDYLRKSVLISTWTRSVLLKDKNAQLRSAKLLKDLSPELSADLSAFISSPNELTAYHLLLKYPVMRPTVEEGFGRFTIPFHIIESYSDNWWYKMNLENKEKFLGEPLTPAFLNAAQIEKAADESRRLLETGHAANHLAMKAVEVAKKYPNANQIPRMLHRAVKAVRHGDSNEAGESAKEAFQILHTKYPKSSWTKKTPYWYAGG